MFKHIVIAAGSQTEAIQEAASQLQALEVHARVDKFHLNPARTGDMLDELLRHTVDSQADLLIVGARRHLIASRMAMLAPCSVLMVPDNSELKLTRILVPVDFSESSADAVRMGFQLADNAGGVCKVVAIESDDEAWLDWKDNPEQLMPHLEEVVERAAGPRARELFMVEPSSRSAARLKGEGLSLAHGIEGADIASTIVDVAGREQTSLIVMGTRGRSRSASILLGSVTEKVMQWSPVPVLAVKRPKGQMGLVEGLLERMRKEKPSLVVS